MNPVDLNLRHLRSFLAVARSGSFTRAARVLHFSQPALTKQIRQLEETLGVRLLDRNTRIVGLTRIGRELAPVVEQLLRQVDAVVVNTKELAEKNRGIIRLASLPSISATILPKAVAGFRERYPGVNVILKDVLAGRLLAMVKAEEVDFGVGSLMEADPELKFTHLLTDGMSVLFPLGFGLEAKKVIKLEDLAGLPLVLMDPESSVRRLVDRAFESIGYYPAPAYEATYMSTAAGMVGAGLGVTILPSSYMEMGELSGLLSRPINHSALARKIGVIEKAGRSLTPAAESFRKSLKDVCKELRR